MNTCIDLAVGYETKLKNMNDKFKNFGTGEFTDEGLLDIFGSFPPASSDDISSATTSRLYLTEKQWRVIGNIQNGKRLLHQNNRCFNCLKFILGKYIIGSNGGLVPTEINQKN